MTIVRPGVPYFSPNYSVREIPMYGNFWQTLEDSAFIDSMGNEWPIPKGFIYNGASIPGLVQWLLGNPHSAPWKMPAKFHDALRNLYGDTVPRWYAADLFYEALLAVKRDFNIPIADWKLKAAQEVVRRVG